MDRTARNQVAASAIKTAAFLFAMIPLAVLAVLIVVLSLVVTAPLTVYSVFTGKNLKNPWAPE